MYMFKVLFVSYVKCKLTNNKAQCFWCINSYVCKVSVLLIENSVRYVELELLLNNLKILF